MSNLAPNYQPASNFASAANTPALSATSSRESPTSVLKSPDLQPGQLLLGEGEGQAKNQQQLKEEQPLPECWGHRGASAAFPENTKASFIEACKAGADGIETDIHIAKDNVLVLFHDPELGRTTTGSGKIHEQPWAGVLEHVRTKQQPIQPIPKFTEVLDLLIAPGHENVKLNIDCKVENEPTKLFSLMKDVIEQYPNWETVLAPRIILGIWHPKFIAPASTILPFLPRYAITMSIPEARTYFFKHVHGFSVRYEYLASAEGERFRKECAAAGKGLCCWTVNGREEMRNCARWGVKSVISDKPEVWREIKREILANRAKALQPTLQTLLLPYIKKANWWFDYEKQGRMETEYLEREGGRFAEVIVPDDVNLKIVRPSDMLPQF